MEELRKLYEKECGKYSRIVTSDADGNTYYSDEYTEWLEEKLIKKMEEIFK